MNIISKLYESYARLQEFVIFVLMMTVLSLVFIQVILRYVLQMPLMGIEELLMFPTIWLYMLGGAQASYERSHISCGILTLYIKRKKSLHLFNIFQTLFSIIIGLWLTRWAWWFLTYSLRTMKESPLLYIPLYLAESAMFVGLALMMFFTVVELFDCVLNYRSTGKDEMIKEAV